MAKTSLKNILRINIGAFILVAILEIMSNLVILDKFETTYSFYMSGVTYTVYIMGVIWMNHFIFIPYFLDKKIRPLYFTVISYHFCCLLYQSL